MVSTDGFPQSQYVGAKSLELHLVPSAIVEIEVALKNSMFVSKTK